jgi:glucokinase
VKACVDIGGTKVAVSLAQGRELAWRRAEPTARTGARGALAQQVIRMIGGACADAGVPIARVDAVGVSACGPFVLQGGAIELAAPNICGEGNGWDSAPLEAPLRELFPRVRVENDAVAALEAERRWGALQGVDHCAYVTWSTGIGVGLCVDGHVLRGKNGNAGHAGHMFVADADEGLCGCGNLGDVEGLVAGRAMPRRFGMEMAALLAASAAGAPQAVARVDGLCRVLGRMLHNLVVTLDLRRIALGGSVFLHHQDQLLPRLGEVLRRGHPAALTGGVEIVPAGLGTALGDHAALALVS